MDREDVTELLYRVNCGEAEAFNSLVSAVYPDLRQMAASFMRNQRDRVTLQPTALVHEAWLNLCGREQQWQGRAHFFGAAARAMRQVLIGRAREKAAQKRAGDRIRVTFSDLHVQTTEPEIDVLLLDEALTALAARDAKLARVMELRYFGGLTLNEIAEAEGESLATAKRNWTYARAWLYDYMNSPPEGNAAHGTATGR